MLNVAADLQNLLQGRPVAEVPLDELVCDPPIAWTHNVHAPLDGALADVVAIQACGFSAPQVGPGCAVEK